jgi:hypothetical protein
LVAQTKKGANMARPKKNKDEEIEVAGHKIVLKESTYVFCPECSSPRISGVQTHSKTCSKGVKQ